MHEVRWQVRAIMAQGVNPGQKEKMVKLRVSVTWTKDPNAPFDIRHILGGIEVRSGIMSDEHAASSYGLPILIMDGVAYGPSDLPQDAEIHPWAIHSWVASSSRASTLLHSVQAAGYILGSEAKARL